jgi:hypothetical protein
MRPFDEKTRGILAAFLAKKIEEGHLTGNDVAKRLEGKPTHASWIKNPTYWKVVPQKVWDKLADWHDAEEIHQRNAGPPEEVKEIVPIIEIEKGIVIPEHVSKASRYPFLKMEIGDSFKVPYTKSQASHLSGATGHFRRAHPEYKFIIRTLKAEGIVRCWRTK